MAEGKRRPLAPGSTIGILGGGQLGRMLSMAASRLGFRTHIYCPDPDSPAFQVSDRKSLSAYDDLPALAEFARSVDVVTYEFENIPAGTAAFLSSRVRVEPDPSILDITQDRLTEKTFIRNQGFAVTAFEPVSSRQELASAAERIGYPCILKTRKLGYDGKGQELIAGPNVLPSAWSAIGGKPAILESLVDFAKEISVIVARGSDGTLRSFDVTENRHENHILRTSTVPAALNEATTENALRAGKTIADALGYIGVLAVELFACEGAEPRLLVNEIAPRVHNSGHWTEDASQVSQFELHVRAIAGWPLPVPCRHSNVEMTNLLGSEILEFASLAGEPNAVVHIYGKSDPRPGRKMGHVNRLAPRQPR